MLFLDAPTITGGRKRKCPWHWISKNNSIKCQCDHWNPNARAKWQDFFQGWALICSKWKRKSSNRPSWWIHKSNWERTTQTAERHWEPTSVAVLRVPSAGVTFTPRNGAITRPQLPAFVDLGIGLNRRLKLHMLKRTWRFYETQKKRLPENTAPCRAPCSACVTWRGTTYLCSGDRRPESASASLFHPMPAPLCLPGERTPCEREEMRCKGQRVPIRATPLSPICAQFMPLGCCGLRGSPAAATGSRKKAIFFKVPSSLSSLSLSVPPFSLVKQNSDTTQ